MPRVSTFIYSEVTSQEILPDNTRRLNLGGIMQIITPEFVPCLYSFSVSFGIIELDMSVPHTFRYTFTSPNPVDPAIIDSTNSDIPGVKDQAYLPQDMQGVLISLDFRNVPLRSEGEYVSSVYVDGELLGEFGIRVKEKKPL